MNEENNSVGEGLGILLLGSFFVLLVVIGIIFDFMHPPKRK